MRRKVSFSRFLKTGSSKQELLCAIGLAQSSFVARELFTPRVLFLFGLGDLDRHSPFAETAAISE